MNAVSKILTINSNVILMCAIIVTGTSSLAYADSNLDLKNAADAACNNIKVCIKKQVANEEGVSVQTQTMIDNMAEQACQSLYQVQDETTDKSLTQPISECYNAMAKTSCEDLENGKQPQVCIELEAKIKDM